MSTGTDGPAFPYVCDADFDYGTGMTLRDYFAAKAMQALIQTPFSKWPADFEDRKISVCAYEMADSMLEAREHD